METIVIIVCLPYTQINVVKKLIISTENWDENYLGKPNVTYYDCQL
jgi:hypothetical protein